MPTSPRTLISIVSPCFNEEQVIGLFYAALCKVLDKLPDYDFELIFIDDGSVDRTLDELNGLAARDRRVRVASFSRNFGHQIALTAGMDCAAGDAVITMDSDLQHPPALLPELLRRWREGNDIVSTVRQDTDGVSIFKKLSSRAFYLLLNALSGVQIPEGAADFCLVSRRVALALRSMRERHRFLRALVSWSGFPRALVPYVAAPRAAGETKYTLFKMVGLALDAILSFSTAPIRLATRLGFVITGLGFAYLAWNLILAFRTGRFAPGWASLISITMMMSGAQLIFIGLIGQYLARVFEEVKGRPMYLFKQEPPLAEARLNPLPATAAASRSS